MVIFVVEGRNVDDGTDSVRKYGGGLSIKSL